MAFIPLSPMSRTLYNATSSISYILFQIDHEESFSLDRDRAVDLVCIWSGIGVHEAVR